MFFYTLKRLAVAVPTFIAVLLITFTLTVISPFDPVAMMMTQFEGTLDTLAKEEVIEKIRDQYGLNDSYWVQFTRWIGRLMQGDLGISINGQRNVLRMIVKTFPISFQLGLAGAVVTTILGIPLGCIAALRQNTWLDYTIVGGTLGFRTVPVFVLAPLLLVLFVLVLDIMRVPRGWDGLFQSKVILPVFILALGPLPVVVRQTRAAVLEVFSMDYVRTAKMKGLEMWRIIIRHILRNALIPVVTTLGFIAEGLIVGSIFLDSIFAIPGFGGVAEAGFRGFDYPVIMGVTMVSAVMIILTNLLVDLIYPFLDPRIKIE
ncbi:MAG: ABC transporter permease [Caldilineaceae bacterium]|nr:ABC transporter permease [Caldilineaceae bacterium]MDE0633724.1 ABC transporter permease [Caldilineaceae bacterium]MXZ20237.1 ABC transporter permease [Caldilineaceae bacterium SB0665_bin_25]